MVRLKHPSLSPDRESAPHWRTTALGWYISMTLAIICTSSRICHAQGKKECLFLNTAEARGQLTHRFEDGLVGLVVDPVPQRVIHGVVFALPSTDVLSKDALAACVTATM